MPYKEKQRQRQYQREWKDRRRKAWLLKNGPCVCCSSLENLQTHHVDPSLKIEHRIWTWSKERLEVELVKCEVLCEKCHKELHAEVNSRPIKHGTHTGYSHYNCRCGLCTQAQYEYMLKWRSIRPPLPKGNL